MIMLEKYEIYANLAMLKSICKWNYSNIYYIKNLKETNAVTLELVAVGKDGSKSKPATCKVNYNRCEEGPFGGFRKKRFPVHVPAICENWCSQRKKAH